MAHASDLESQAAALWVRAIDARPELAKEVLELMQQPMPGADVRRVSEFLAGKPSGTLRVCLAAVCLAADSSRCCCMPLTPPPSFQAVAACL